MKKLILTLSAAFLLCNIASAQFTGFQAGAGAVVDLFVYNGSVSAESPDVLSGYQAYLSYEYDFNQFVGASAGLRFSQVGLIERKAVKHGQESNTRSWNKTHIELPVMFVSHVWKGVFITMGAVGECGVAYNMKDVRKSGDTIVSTQVENLFNRPKFKDVTVYPRFNLGVESQLGYDFSHLRLYAGFKYDFFNVYNYGERNCKMMQIQIGLAAKF